MTRTLFGILVAFVLAVGCGGSTPSRCQSVSVEMVSKIEQGASSSVLHLTHAQAVQSKDFKRVYFVSAKVTAPGVPDAVGTWATNRLDPAEGGVVVAVDEVAHAATVWPRSGQSTAIPATMNDDGAQLSRGCVK